MPNHITNKLVIEAGDAEKIFSFLKNGDSDFDFNKIVPQPKALDIESGSNGEMGYELFYGGKSEYGFLSKSELRKRFNERDPKDQEEIMKLGAQYASNKRNFGHTTWYNWSRTHWGTKWNAYSTKRDGNVLTFETAWSGVPNLIVQLSMIFPDARFSYEFADEDTGSNTGRFLIADGEIIDENRPENRSKEAYELAFLLDPDSRQYYEFKDGNYEYKEEEE